MLTRYTDFRNGLVQVESLCGYPENGGCPVSGQVGADPNGGWWAVGAYADHASF